MRLFIVILVISLLYGCNKKIVTNTYKGIKSIKTIQKDMKSQKSFDETPAKKTIYEEFDTSGNPIFLKSDSWMGKEQLERKFNNEGQLIETFSEKFIGVYHHKKYFYDDEGKKILEIWYEKDKNVIYEWKIETDLDSLMIKEYEVEKVKDTVLLSVTSLDRKLKPLTQSFFDREGFQTYYYEFNEHGLKERVISFNKDGVIDVEYLFYYNKRREEVRQVEKFNVSKRFKEIETLYKDGKLTKKTTKFNSDEGESVLTRTYDKKGNILYENNKSSTGKWDYSYRFGYDYDLRGNWIKKKEYHNGELNLETKRIIEYY